MNDIIKFWRRFRKRCTIGNCPRRYVYDLGVGYDKVCREHL